MKRKALIITTMIFLIDLRIKACHVMQRSYAIDTFGRNLLIAAHERYDFYLYKQQIAVLLKSYNHQLKQTIIISE